MKISVVDELQQMLEPGSLQSTQIEAPDEQLVPVHSLPPLNPLHFNEDGVMIGHHLIPMDKPSEGIFWCRICGGHPDDPIHKQGYIP